MKTNILKVIIVGLSAIIAGCHSGSAQTSGTGGADSVTSKSRDTIPAANTIRKDTGRILHDSIHRNRDTVKP